MRAASLLALTTAILLTATGVATAHEAGWRQTGHATVENRITVWVVVPG